MITSLERGGAQSMLFKLVSAQRELGVESQVVALTSHDAMAVVLRSEGFRVDTLGMPPGAVTVGGLRKLGRVVRRSNADVVQTWMYHADLLGGVAARSLTSARIAWGLRGSVDTRVSKITSRATAKLCALLSSTVPDRIISCSWALAEIHKEMGYRSDKIEVIPNGFDTEVWRRDDRAAREVRTELDLPDDAVVLGVVARWDPQKDHRTLLQAAAQVLQRANADTTHFVLCGNGIELENAEFARAFELIPFEYRARFRLLGPRGDVRRLTNAFDIAVSSSAFGEGFHNVLGEAMANGVPCIATDVGDARHIVADTGLIVPPRDPETLAAALLRLIRLKPDDRRSLGEKARRRVVDEFGLAPVALRYWCTYRDMLAAR